MSDATRLSVGDEVRWDSSTYRVWAVDHTGKVWITNDDVRAFVVHPSELTQETP